VVESQIKMRQGFIHRYFKGWNWFEITYLCVVIVLPIIVGVLLRSSILQIITTIIWLVVSILLAKGKPEGTVLDLVACILYPIVAFQQALYGEVITQLFVILPLCIYAVFSWLRNRRRDDKKGEVAIIKKINWKEVFIVVTAQVIMGIGYFFLLQFFGTSFLWLSTILMAVVVFSQYFMARRCMIGYVGFVITDFLQIAIWILVAVTFDVSSAVMVIVPAMLLITDVYGIIEWRKLYKTQNIT